MLAGLLLLLWGLTGAFHTSRFYISILFLFVLLSLSFIFPFCLDYYKQNEGELQQIMYIVTNNHS